jgi:3-carboxy-cis,cis-muconate cycloisomerase
MGVSIDPPPVTSLDVSAADPFSGVFSHGPVAGLVDGNAWTQAMLDFEGGLARACAAAGVIPAESAPAITAACRVEEFDVAAIGREAAAGGNPAIPLVAALRARVPDEFTRYVHRGATSQDVIDTAMMLVARRALTVILSDAARVATSAAALVEPHRRTVMPGRTLLQQAVPVTFGLKAAGWLTAVERARAALERAASTEPALQFGGAAGTLASLGDHGIAVSETLADELGLPLPLLPWHTDRTRLVALAGPLAALVGALGKIARDVELLAQNEVAEVVSGTGGSSAMPHKRNPVQAVAVVACAMRVPGPLATLNAAMLQEHERAAGAWHAEWEPFTELLRLAGSAVAWSAEMLEGLHVDTERMRANLDAAGDLIMAESVAAALGWRPDGGRLVDDAVARAVAEETTLREALLADPELPWSPQELDRELDPAVHLGVTQVFIGRALQAYEHDEESR